MGASNSMNKGKVMDASNRSTITKILRRKYSIGALVEHLDATLRVEGSRPASANFLVHHSENATENSGTNSKKLFLL